MERENIGKSKVLNDSYLNSILLKIRRNHPESVAIRLLEQEIEQIRIENGKNSAYIAELEDTVAQFEKMSDEELDQWKVKSKNNKKITEMKKALAKAQKDAKEWQDKYFALLQKQKGQHP